MITSMSKYFFKPSASKGSNHLVHWFTLNITQSLKSWNLKHYSEYPNTTRWPVSPNIPQQLQGLPRQATSKALQAVQRYNIRQLHPAGYSFWVEYQNAWLCRLLLFQEENPEWDSNRQICADSIVHESRWYGR